MTGPFATDRVDEKAWTGRVLGGKYRLEQCIGRSADTMVYRARQLNLRRDVAVKILFANPQGAMQLGDRMRREARLVAAIRHPGTAEMYDEGVTDDGRPYLVMELLRGQTLDDLIAAHERLPVTDAVKVLQQVATVLGAVHDAGYVHRDIKPSNIFLEQVGSDLTVKLIDFGTARPVRARFADDVVAKKTLGGLGAGTQINTLPGIVFGTPSYMSPEQCRGDEVDATSDIYSLGVVFYQMLCGKLPFEDVHAVRVMARHLVETPPKLAQKALDASDLAPMEAVVARALAKDRRERHQSVMELARAALEASAEGVEKQPSLIPLLVEQGAPEATRNVASEETRPAKRFARRVPALPRGLILATTVVSMGGLFVASVFALARYTADVTGDNSARQTPSSTIVEAPQGTPERRERRAIESFAPVVPSAPRPDATGGAADASRDARAASRAPAARLNSVKATRSVQNATTQTSTTSQSSRPTMPARRFNFGLDLMRPQEK